MVIHRMLFSATVALLASVGGVSAYLTMSLSSTFMGQRAVVGASVKRGAVSANGYWKMDMERDSLDLEAREKLVRMLRETSVIQSTINLERAEAEHGMPWKSSIDPKATLEDNGDLLYMPYWEWQMSFMKEHLTNLRVVSCSDDNKTDFSYRANEAKKARIVNLCVASDEYRKIRLTYYDAGDNTQVFNSVWYPDPKYNLPVLGIDLLAFNRKKYLAIVDFQPLHEKEDDHASKYEHLLSPIKEQYDSLKGGMSAKFYDETQFFSQQMLFARFEDEAVIGRDLFPAFCEYVKTHLELIKQTPADVNNIGYVMSRQKAYDTYSAERDPATGLFTAMFGESWAQDFVHNFLFDLSDRTKEDETTTNPPNPGPGSPSMTPRTKSEAVASNKQQVLAGQSRQR